ncbi:hypothetical protein [Bacillus sp. JCM 19034]|uniref:hypothetical protein n=1 Tax=Bacillus sp. JCM 19034 TaxID=1481928 RepID=UPI0007804A6B|nr:hypothetical protein [Bacillus sp. JCM 19034]
MKTAPLQSYNQFEIALILDSLRQYIDKVSIPSARIIFTDYIKVVIHGNQVQLDGMGMEHIFCALMFKAEEMSLQLSEEQSEVVKVKQMAKEIREKRILSSKHFIKHICSKKAFNPQYRNSE